jgi:hypothetical protein
MLHSCFKVIELALGLVLPLLAAVGCAPARGVGAVAEHQPPKGFAANAAKPSSVSLNLF